MKNAKFHVGERVIWVSYKRPYDGIGGTIVKVESLPNAGGIYGAPTQYLRVVLDTAEIIDDEANNFVTDEAYKNNTWIPF